MAKPKKEQIQQVLDLLKKEGKPIPKNELATSLGLEQRAANVLLAALECMGYITVGMSERNTKNLVERFGLVRLAGTAPPERGYGIYIPPSDGPARPGGLDFLNCFSRRGNLFVPMRERGRIYATSSVPHDHHHLREKMSTKTTFANGINPFTGSPSAAVIVYESNAPLYSFLELLRIHEKWVEGGRIGQQPFASAALPELTQSVGCSMNIAAKDMLMRERVTWSKKTGEIRIKDVEQTAAKAARKNSKAQAAA